MSAAEKIATAAKELFTPGLPKTDRLEGFSDAAFRSSSRYGCWKSIAQTPCRANWAKSC